MWRFRCQLKNLEKDKLFDTLIPLASINYSDTFGFCKKLELTKGVVKNSSTVPGVGSADDASSSSDLLATSSSLTAESSSQHAPSHGQGKKRKRSNTQGKAKKVQSTSTDNDHSFALIHNQLEQHLIG